MEQKRKCSLPNKALLNQIAPQNKLFYCCFLLLFFDFRATEERKAHKQRCFHGAGYLSAFFFRCFFLCATGTPCETMAVPPRPIATGTEGNGSLTKEFAGSWSGTDGGENMRKWYGWWSLYDTLGFLTPGDEVFVSQKHTQNTFSAGIWKTRDSNPNKYN